MYNILILFQTSPKLILKIGFVKTVVKLISSCGLFISLRSDTKNNTSVFLYKFSQNSDLNFSSTLKAIIGVLVILETSEKNEKVKKGLKKK